MRLEAKNLVTNAIVIDHDSLDAIGKPRVVAALETVADAELFKLVKEAQEAKEFWS